jgi:drug/metabolite transporter (DMT)-like permease
VAKWAAFWVLGVVWGSSFLLIRVGVEAIHPFYIVFIRTGIAAVGLFLVVIARRRPIPRDWQTIKPLLILGVGNTAIPFTLISMGEKTVESGLASVLQATAALFGLIIAHFALADERITPQKLWGLIVGFVGVLVLASRNWQDGQIVTGGLLGQLAIVGASFFYASFTTYSRKVVGNSVEPMVIAAFAMMTAAFVELALILVSPLLGYEVPPVPADLTANVLFSVLLLGFLNTFFAYMLFYYIVRELGAAKSQMVTYVVPAVGLLLGVLLLNESMDIRLILGAALIFAGIGIVNLKIFQRQKSVTVAPQTN